MVVPLYYSQGEVGVLESIKPTKIYFFVLHQIKFMPSKYFIPFRKIQFI